MTEGRKIYERVVMDMCQEGFPVLEEDSYYYTGPMALCDGEDNSADDDEGKDDNSLENDTKEDPNKLIIESLNELKKAVSGNQEAVKQINEHLSTLKKPNKETSKDDNDDDLPSNLELLDRKDFMNIIIKKISKLVEDQVKPVSEKTRSIEESTQLEQLRKERDELRGKHKDFDEWRDEMKGLFKQNPYLTMKQAYILAKSSDPKKAKKLEDKYAEVDDDNDAKGKKFGGLTPVDRARKKTKGKEVKGAEASELAWQIVMGDKDDFK